jgi:RNA polymerase sigma factor (sigma-70 family)
VSGSQASTAVEEEATGEVVGAGSRAGDDIRRVRIRDGRIRLHPVRRAPAGASWDERCSILFEDLRKPARVMVGRAFGNAFSPEAIEDVYANAWASTLAALRGRESQLSDEELRSYVLTAVANHASKEMRRRRRKPTGALDDAHEQVLFDRSQPGPEERASGSETGQQARDVLASLPPRRRAVMLLRYGWGLEPKEVCRLIDGLSPRAYRKEITRGVEEMIARFGQLESGEWCTSRRPLLRDYVAGVADADRERQAREHISHCRHCNELVGRLSAGLHELGAGAAAWTVLAGSLGEAGDSFGERLSALLDRSRDAALRGREGAEAAAAQTAEVAAAGGLRGAGAAGAGVLAKLAGLGVAGKVAVACVSAGAVGGACLATGVIDPPGGPGGPERPEGARPIRVDARGPAAAIAASAEAAGAEARTASTIDRIGQIELRERREAAARRREERQAAELAAAATTDPLASAPVDGATSTAGAPATSPAPTAPASEQEFGLPGAASGGSASTSPGPGDSGATGGDVAGEFGP